MSLLHLVVPAQRAAVRYRHGAVLDVLPAGRHRRVRSTRVVEVDLRERLLAVAPQEVPTADEGVVVRVSAAVRWEVDDPAAWLDRSVDPAASLYLATQVALRESFAGRPIADLTGRGSAVPSGDLTRAVATAMAPLGLRVLEVVVKDVVLPAELRHAAVAVLTARQRGLAQLETARAETAALRSLANGARLLDSHPALARLRLVQSAPPGAQVVLRLGPDPEPTTGGTGGA